MYDDYQEMSSFWKAYLPDEFGRLVEKHAKLMQESGYLEKISEYDFDHGHIMLKAGCPEVFASLNEMFSYVSGILYHTREHQKHWQKEAGRGLPVSERTPRSIIGYRNGAIEPAINLISNLSVLDERYSSNGTIFPQQLYQLYAYHCNEESIVMNVNGIDCRLGLTLQIEINSIGRFKLKGQKYEIFLRCFTLE